MWDWLEGGAGPTGDLGQQGEDRAKQLYKNKGYKILAANFFNKRGKQVGEVDFIARDKNHIAFVEVKTRRSGEGKFGSGAEAVNVFKQQKLLKAAKVFLNQHPELRQLQPRIDVCLIEGQVDKNEESVRIITNAVEDIG